jgi:hypothetical protein
MTSNARIHGHNRSPTHIAWKHMMGRCLNPRNKAWANYGGRGIAVCASWRGRYGFNQFLKDVGERPSPLHSLDRIDNSGHYEPGNVRWATKNQQNRNRRSNLFVSHNGQTKTLAEWADSSPVSQQLIRTRWLRYGWSFDAALNTPTLFTPRRAQTEKPLPEGPEGALS